MSNRPDDRVGELAVMWHSKYCCFPFRLSSMFIRSYIFYPGLRWVCSNSLVTTYKRQHSGVVKSQIFRHSMNQSVQIGKLCGYYFILIMVLENFDRNRTGFGSFWPEPDQNRIASLKKLTWFDMIGRVLTVFSILNNNTELTNHKRKHGSIVL